MRFKVGDKVVVREWDDMVSKQMFEFWRENFMEDKKRHGKILKSFLPRLSSSRQRQQLSAGLSHG